MVISLQLLSEVTWILKHICHMTRERPANQVSQNAESKQYVYSSVLPIHKTEEAELALQGSLLYIEEYLSKFMQASEVFSHFGSTEVAFSVLFSPFFC